MTSKDLLRAAVMVLIGLGAGIFSLVQGLSRSGGRGVVYLLLAALMGVCLVGMAIRVLRVWRQERSLSAEERVVARAARLEQWERTRPRWLDSRGAVVVVLVGAAWWAFLLVLTLEKGAYGLAALDGLALFASVWTAKRMLRRRRRQGI